jgi:hypothetical protein
MRSIKETFLQSLFPFGTVALEKKISMITHKADTAAKDVWKVIIIAHTIF